MKSGWGISYEIALRWMPQDLTDDRSTLVQVMAWCRQATSHYLSQCWPRSMSPNGVTRPQWVNIGFRSWFVGWRLQAWSNIDLSSKVSYGIHLRPISQEVLKWRSEKNWTCSMCVRRSPPHLPGVSELRSMGGVRKSQPYMRNTFSDSTHARWLWYVQCHNYWYGSVCCEIQLRIFGMWRFQQ